ncbi:cation efflux system protein CzcB [Dulcicalothrix desertica PCC 7102]|uniref:Cation efflux system protein CzcB n=1 Tax=Dulcicalothrix desertica PCC 7102 TaxID=232991 RepID=A0A3S1AH31_9CYAN|nr:efflux RND transporter periplasmic adaptor subunit [Dulcicalothrix desertica]RUT00620.1 cation efflux system protein CzcB [Dulcicalothrix desertica PCC 7102]TWH53237.1 cobalt-zinc-cadmium efflux system membrane fusion protein [Dulcicalothrix desertica PCC 7102]
MGLSNRTQKAIYRLSGTLINLLLLASPAVVLAHGGHGNEFKSGGDTATPSSVQVDTDTANRLGIKTQSVKRQLLAVGIKTTGQIETLPSQKVEVTTPSNGAKVVELLVEPGATVTKGQPVAVLTSPDLVTLRVESQEKRADATASLQQAQTDLKLAQQNYQRYVQIANAEIAEAQSQVSFATEKYSKDKQLADAGALPRRNALESQTQLAEARAKLTTARSRRDVIESEAQIKRAQSALQVAQERLRLSDSTYQTRLQQIGNAPNSKGLVTVTAPISGKVADREVTLGQTFNDAGGKLMTIINDSRVFATANIYEKDLGKVKVGQRIKVKVASLPNTTFSGRISRVGTLVSGETQVLPVQAEIENAAGQLKPGMFAELEVLTDKTSTPVTAIPTAAVVDANGKKLVYIQNGNAYQASEVTLGQTSGDMVEIKSGLFNGDVIVIQRAPQLYAQSLRGGTTDEHSHAKETQVKTNNSPIPLWLLGVGGIGVVGVAFAAGSYWSSRRTRDSLVTIHSASEKILNLESEVYIDNHKQ